MTEPTSFEAREVLGPRRRRLSRITILLPVLILVVIAWAGYSGTRSDPATAEASGRTSVAAPSVPVAGSTPATVPAEAIGLHVQQLDDVQPSALNPDDDVAVAGWYLATAVTDCPAIVASYRQGALSPIRGDADALAFCVRSGLLYPSQPNVHDNRDGSGERPAVRATAVTGVHMPPELENIGAEATEVVLVGRFVESLDECHFSGACPREFLIDHVAWTPGG